MKKATSILTTTDYEWPQFKVSHYDDYTQSYFRTSLTAVPSAQ